MKKWRVAEIFGPTVQGEGRNIGMPCYFVRLGGCDSRCTWCDTPHAVLPEMVNTLPQMGTSEIVVTLQTLSPEWVADWVVITGGNPALFDLRELVAHLHMLRYKVMVETQGTIYKEWLQHVDDLCVSPKPPSSGNPLAEDDLRRFMEKFFRMPAGDFSKHIYFKVVVFDDGDYEYAQQVRKWFPDVEMFLSVGNEDPSLPTVGDPYPDMQTPVPLPNLRNALSESYRDLIERCLKDPLMRDVRVFPQLHVLAWGNGRGH